MKSNMLILLIVSSVLALGMPMAADDPQPTKQMQTQAQIKQELMEREKEWARAIETNDAAEIGRFMSDDWCLIGPDGSIMPKSRFLGVIKSGEVTHDLMKFDDWRIRVYGDTAVVSVKGTSQGTYKGRAFSTYERSTSVYARMDGRWQCVLTQLTAMKKKTAPEK